MPNLLSADWEKPNLTSSDWEKPNLLIKMGCRGRDSHAPLLFSLLAARCRVAACARGTRAAQDALFAERARDLLLCFVSERARAAASAPAASAAAPRHGNARQRRWREWRAGGPGAAPRDAGGAHAGRGAKPAAAPPHVERASRRPRAVRRLRQGARAAPAQRAARAAQSAPDADSSGAATRAPLAAPPAAHPAGAGGGGRGRHLPAGSQPLRCGRRREGRSALQRSDEGCALPTRAPTRAFSRDALARTEELLAALRPRGYEGVFASKVRALGSCALALQLC